MNSIDEELYNAYMVGYEDGLDGEFRKYSSDPELQHEYEMGYEQAQVDLGAGPYTDTDW